MGHRGRGLGYDHHRWPHRSFAWQGLFSLNNRSSSSHSILSPVKPSTGEPDGGNPARPVLREREPNPIGPHYPIVFASSARMAQWSCRSQRQHQAANKRISRQRHARCVTLTPKQKPRSRIDRGPIHFKPCKRPSTKAVIGAVTSDLVRD